VQTLSISILEDGSVSNDGQGPETSNTDCNIPSEPSRIQTLTGFTLAGGL
jgi:hypothetical protein